MSCLIDTNVLLRFVNARDLLHSQAYGAVMHLHRNGEQLHIASQNLVEFWNVATRPLVANGLGASPSEAAAAIEELERAFTLVSDTADIHTAWKSLVTSLGVIGKQVHDARLVAICQVRRIDKLLTFNVAHFQRLVSLQAQIAVLNPATL